MRRVGSDDDSFQTGYFFGFQPWEDAFVFFGKEK